MIVPDVRSSFGRSHAALLVHLLERAGERAEALEETLSERGIDPLLDHPALVEAISGGGGVAGGGGISALPLPLVAYILLRHGLLDERVDNRLLADYLTALFLRFGMVNRAFRIRDVDDQEYRYLVDLVAELAEADGRRAFLLRAHLGNLALWLSGLFPDWIQHRVHRRGGPGIDYYEEMGQTGFSLAAEDPHARREALDELFREAAASFVPMRRALNRFSDRFLTPTPESPVDRLLRQAADDFEAGRLQA